MPEFPGYPQKNRRRAPDPPKRNLSPPPFPAPTGDVRITDKGGASIPPSAIGHAIAESKSTKVTLSLLTVAVVFGSGVWLGRDWGAAEGRAEQVKELMCKDASEKYQRLIDLRGLDAAHLEVIERGVGKATTQLEVIESHVVERRKR